MPQYKIGDKVKVTYSRIDRFIGQIATITLVEHNGERIGFRFNNEVLDALIDRENSDGAPWTTMPDKVKPYNPVPFTTNDLGDFPKR